MSRIDANHAHYVDTDTLATQFFKQDAAVCQHPKYARAVAGGPTCGVVAPLPNSGVGAGLAGVDERDLFDLCGVFDVLANDGQSRSGRSCGGR